MTKQILNNLQARITRNRCKFFCEAKPLIFKILKKQKFLILILILANSNACAMPFFNKNKLPSTPYALEIDISKKGNKAEIDLRIKTKKERKELEPESIAFEVYFNAYDPRNDKNSKYYENSFTKFFKDIGVFKKYFKYTKEEKDEIWKDNERLTKLLGGGIWFDDGTEYGKRIDHPAIPLPNIRLTITNLENQQIVYDEILEMKKHPNIAGYFYKFLEYVKLLPGKYKIIAEVQSDALEFKGTEVLLLIGSQRAWWK